MPDLKVTFRGDLGNLAQFDAAVKNSANSMAASLRNANNQIASLGGSISVDTGNNIGNFVRNQKTAIDSLNNTFRQSGERFTRALVGYGTAIDNVSKKTIVKPLFSETYTASFDKAIGNLKLYEAALKRVAPLEAQILENQRKGAQIQANLSNFRDTKLAQRAKLEKELAGKVDTFIPTGPTSRGTIAAVLHELNFQEAELLKKTATPETATLLSKVRGEIADVQRLLAAAEAPLRAEIAKIDALLNRVDEVSRRSGANTAAREAGIRTAPAYRALDRAANATPPIDSNLARVLTDSEQLRKKLLQGGLGAGTQYGTKEFQKALADQEAAVTSYTRNLRTGVRTVQGEFKNLNTGMLERFTVDLDDQGKVVGRWGGQLSGASNILKQTVRDFQKVIEWTVATTVVFGSLAAVFSQFQSINELNNSLTRFSVTAQTSAEETNRVFKELSEVAYNTATPLNALIKVADDIALATKRAGQSSQEWRADIVDLTTAVGIFTNLTGTDTVEAADQLSAAFKQLGVAPSELVGVLNKVTAVAGGQSGAISDIVKAISSVSEAARASKLTIDEQIASVQVLSQVTNKSAADVATAFKNLFGSVSSVGSEKILRQFGIQIRDAEGGLKGFLEIYREIAAALESGVIPQNRLPDVLRGIAGGPRRAPDAAALLSNLGRIDEVVATSANATNEALIANAKILGTNQAKMVQLQNSINTVIFEKFGKAVAELVDVLVDLGTVATRVLGGLDPELVNLALKLGIVLTSIKVFGSLIKLLGGGLLGGAIESLGALGRSFLNAGKYAKIATAEIRELDRSETVANSVFKGSARPAVGTSERLFNVLSNNKKALGIGAIGAAATIGALNYKDSQGKGIDTNLIGTILQGAGAAASFVPGLQAVGVAAILAGTGLQLLAGNSNDLTKSSAETSAEIYTLTQNIQATQKEADSFVITQGKALKIINELKDKTGKTAEEQAQLSAATTDYVTATLGLAKANQTVSATFQDLIDKIPKLAAAYDAFKNGALLSPNDPQLKKLQEQLAQDILRNSGQGIYAGEPVPFATEYKPPRAGSTNVTTDGQLIIPSPFGQASPSTFDLNKLLKDPAALKELFLPGFLESTGGWKGHGYMTSGRQGDIYGTPTPFSKRQQATEAALQGNDTALRIVQNALTTLGQDFQEGKGNVTEEELKLLQEIVTHLSTSASSSAENAAALAQLNANVQSKIASGALRGETAQNATAAASLATALQKALDENPIKAVNGTPEARDAAFAANNNIISRVKSLGEGAITGKPLSGSTLIGIGKDILSLNGSLENLKIAGDAAINQGIVEALKAAGASAEQLDRVVALLPGSFANAAAAAADLTPLLDNAKQQAAQNYGERQLQLQIAKNSGQFEDNAKGLSVLIAQNDQAYQSNLKLIDSFTALSDIAFVDLNNTLAQTLGLQGQYISQTELNTLGIVDEATGLTGLQQRQADFGAILVENAVKLGLNAEQIRKVTEQALLLDAAIRSITPYRQVIVEVTTLYNEGGRTGSGGKDPRSQQRLNEANKALKKATGGGSEIDKIIKEIQKLFRSGKGSSLGSLPKGLGGGGGGSAAYNKPGLLDIPKEVLAQTNYRDLVKEAIAKARKLQSEVPGETKHNKNEIVELLNGTKKILETRGIGEEYLRRAMDELTDQIKKQNDLLGKADTIRRIRVGAGSFAALANVPLNSKSGVSVGGPNGPINVSLNLNGTVLTPAQFAQFAEMIAASIKKQIAA